MGQQRGHGAAECRYKVLAVRLVECTAGVRRRTYGLPERSEMIRRLADRIAELEAIMRWKQHSADSRGSAARRPASAGVPALERARKAIEACRRFIPAA